MPWSCIPLEVVSVGEVPTQAQLDEVLGLDVSLLDQATDGVAVREPVTEPEARSVVVRVEVDHTDVALAIDVRESGHIGVHEAVIAADDEGLGAGLGDLTHQPSDGLDRAFVRFDVNGGIAVVGDGELLEGIDHDVQVGCGHLRVGQVRLAVADGARSVCGAAHSERRVQAGPQHGHVDVGGPQVGRRQCHWSIEEGGDAGACPLHLVAAEIDEAGLSALLQITPRRPPDGRGRIIHVDVITVHLRR